jgi:hypothetical protein
MRSGRSSTGCWTINSPNSARHRLKWRSVLHGETSNSYKNHQRGRRVDVAGFIGRLLAAGGDCGDRASENGNGGRRERQLAGSRRLSHRLSVFGQLGGGNRPRPGFGGEMHVVYASPGTIAAYRKDGRFLDGSVLVKEVFEATTGAMTTGNVSHAKILKGWFVMMKDSKNSHPDNKLWGDGWGWSWFDSAAPSKTTSTNYKVDCQSCHVPARASDWIYVQGYPALKQ